MFSVMFLALEKRLVVSYAIKKRILNILEVFITFCRLYNADFKPFKSFAC